MADSLFDSGFTTTQITSNTYPTMAIGSHRPELSSQVPGQISGQLSEQQQQQQHAQSSTTPNVDSTQKSSGSMQSNITIRALVSSKEAGAIIGKAGKNVADLREQTHVKAGVSKPVPGVPDRVLTISGILENVAFAYSLASATLVENQTTGTFVHSLSPPPPPGIATIRLLIPHQQMGTIIGRQGLKIKSIQENCKVRMVASKEMLPQSTERIVEIQGTPEAVKAAVWEIGKCLIEDWERATGSIPYNPIRSSSLNLGGSSVNANISGGAQTNSNIRKDNDDNIQQQISIPSDMVGCIIGKGGTKIQEIRRASGARISIAKEPHDETGERLFTIQGSQPCTDRALYLLYEQLELEKGRRGQ
jgi:heterogeneous nuclear rnp K-like protein